MAGGYIVGAAQAPAAAWAAHSGRTQYRWLKAQITNQHCGFLCHTRTSPTDPAASTNSRSGNTLVKVGPGPCEWPAAYRTGPHPAGA